MERLTLETGIASEIANLGFAPDPQDAAPSRLEFGVQAWAAAHAGQ